MITPEDIERTVYEINNEIAKYRDKNNRIIRSLLRLRYNFNSAAGDYIEYMREKYKEDKANDQRAKTENGNQYHKRDHEHCSCKSN